MKINTSVYVLVCLIALIAVIALWYAFFSGHFVATWVCGVIIVLCMEGRVQIGGRIQHDRVFWIHLGTAVPFFVALSLLAFVDHGRAVRAVTAILFIATFIPGAMLWYRGLHALSNQEHTATG